MFDSWFLETFSKTPWCVQHCQVFRSLLRSPDARNYAALARWTVPLLWLPLVLSSLRAALWEHGTGAAACAACAAAGLLAWATLEYCLHRFVFHAQPRHPLAIMLHFSLHGCHHKQPGDRLRLVFPPLFAAPLVAFFRRVCLLAAGGAPGPGAALFGGMLLGYVHYDVGHYLMHSPAPPRWLARARRVHLAHHYVDDTRSFGVSSDLLDVVFGTLPKRAAP